MKRLLWRLYPQWVRAYLFRRSLQRLVVATEELTAAMSAASEAWVADAASLARLRQSLRDDVS